MYIACIGLLWPNICHAECIAIPRIGEKRYQCPKVKTEQKAALVSSV